MASGVVDGLLENEIKMAPPLRRQLDGAYLFRRPEFPVDAFGLKHVGRELPYSREDVPQIVLAGINRPDDVAHRVNEAAGGVCDVGQHIERFSMIDFSLALDYLAQDSHPRQACADVVVQISCYSGAHPLQLQQAGDSIAISGVDSKPDQRRGDRQEPPSAPDRRQDFETYAGG